MRPRPRTPWLTAALLLTLGLCANAQTQIKTNIGTLTVEDNGKWELKPTDNDKGAFGGELAFYAPGWRYIAQPKAADTKLVHEDGSQQWQWTGTLTEPTAGLKLVYEQTITVENGIATIHYTATPSGDVPCQGGSRGLFVALNLPGATYTGQVVKAGGNAYKLPANNVWSYGNRVTMDPADVDVKVDHTGSLSLWDQRKYTQQYQVRAYLQQEKNDQPNKITGPCKITIQLQPQEKPIDSSAVISIEDRWIKSIDDYRRILQLPLLTGFTADQPLAWLDHAAEAAKTDKTGPEVVDNVRRVEDWLNLHAQLADLADQVHHLRIFSRVMDYQPPAEVNTQYEQLLAALNEGRVDDGLAQVGTLRSLLDQARVQTQQQFGCSYWPGQAVNPLGFIKAMNMVGYAWRGDGLVPPDPQPWHIAWQGGQTLSLVKKPEYEMGDPSWHMQRSWVSTTWVHGTSRYTFSVLTPLVLVEHVQSLPIGGTAGKIAQVTYRAATGQAMTAPVDGFAGQDLKLGANWLQLAGPDTALLVFVGRAPTVEVNDGGLVLRFDQPTWAAVMAMDPGASQDQCDALAERWSHIAVAPPVEVIERVADQQATYRYVYRDQPDAFDTQPRYIAPLPGLFIQAGRLPDDAVRQTLPGGMTYAYVPGRQLSLDVPAAKQPFRRGINEYADRLTESRVQALADQGAAWVRVLGSKSQFHDKPDAQYAAFDRALANLQRHHIKALLDAHDFGFQVHRGKGIPTDPEARQPFIDLWQHLATIGHRYPDTVVGYDLYNELRIGGDEWPAWEKLAGEAITAVRAIDPDTPIYISGTDMSNPTGYTHAQPLPQSDLVYSFHFYAPHAFSHQKIMVRSEYDSFVFYPGWVPQIDWKHNKLYGDATPRWWDRWAIGASMYPVLSFMARNDVPMHCGEIGAIGYTKPKAAMSAWLWTRDGMDWLRRENIPWHLWNQGFGLTVEPVAEEVFARWQSAHP